MRPYGEEQGANCARYMFRGVKYHGNGWRERMTQQAWDNYRRSAKRVARQAAKKELRDELAAV